MDDDLLNNRDMGCFDFDGNPISLLEWSELSQDPDRQVGDDHIGDYRISTVWIGVHVHDGRPLIYETMIFLQGTPDRMRRYYTRAEAERGHDETVATVKAEIS